MRVSLIARKGISLSHQTLLQTTMSSGVRTPELPLDIIHAVLEQFKLPQDRPTLSACSRVCQDWLPVARKYLFARVTVRSRVDDTNEPPRGWEVFGDHFYKPVHCIPAFVTHLVLIGSLTQNLDLSRLALLLRTFPILKNLSICSYNIATLDRPPQPIGYPRSLDVLEIKNIVCYTASTGWGDVFIPPQKLLDLLHQLPRAETMVFSGCPVYCNVKIAEEPDFANLDIPTDFAPSSVHLLTDPIDNYFLLHLLQHIPSTARTLRTLRIAFHDIAYLAPSVGRLLTAARNLEVLELDFSIMENREGTDHLQAGKIFATPWFLTFRSSDSLASMVALLVGVLGCTGVLFCVRGTDPVVCGSRRCDGPPPMHAKKMLSMADMLQMRRGCPSNSRTL